MFKTVNLIILAILLSLASCSEKDNSIFGPKYISAPSDLEVVDNTFKIVEDGDEFDIDLPVITFYDPDYPDSVLNAVIFKAELSDSVTWIFTISDLVTGAEKKIIGTSKNVSAKWSGDSDNIAFFSKFDPQNPKNLKVELSFIGIDKKVVRFLTFDRPKLFPNTILVADFEEDGQAIVKGSVGDPDGWFDFFDTEGEDETISRGVGPDNIIVARPSKASEPVESIQGQGYYHLRGDDNSVKPSPFFIGGMGHDAVVYGLPSISPNEVFLNFYANSNGNTTTKLVVEIAGFGGDLFTKEIAVNWDGWNLVSVRLSDFSLTTSGTIGTGEILTPLLESMKFAIHSGGGVAGSIAEINIDYVTFTIGKPFRQQ